MEEQKGPKFVDPAPLPSPHSRCPWRTGHCCRRSHSGGRLPCTPGSVRGARREFGEILARLSQTIIIVTHDLPYAHEICERAVIIDGGRIVADGSSDEILGDAELLAAHDLELPHGFVMDHH